MYHEIKFDDNTKMIIKNYQSNVEFFYDDMSYSETFDGCDEFPVEDNVAAAFFNITNHFDLILSEDDKKKLMDLLKIIFYPHSQEVYSEL